MNTIAIDPKIYKSAELFARNSNVSMREFIEKAILAAMPRSSVKADTSATKQGTWHKYEVSPEVMAMTFDESKDIPDDYTAELHNVLAEKYL